MRRSNGVAKADARPSNTAPVGTRVMMWKQDPSVGEIGMRKTFLPDRVLDGPRDDQIIVRGLQTVRADPQGDFIELRNSEAFDAVHTFAVVRQTVTMYERALAGGGAPATIRWQWNGMINSNPIQVLPYGLPDEANAYYTRQTQSLSFGHFMPMSNGGGRVFTCRSLDIVSHETGHAILDGLKPNWLADNAPPQTGALHESFGDVTAIFLVLSQLDQVEAVIAQTRANLRDKSFLVDLAEEFGLHEEIARNDGLRNAANNLKVSTAGVEVHDLSLVFTGAVYDIVADVFALKRQPAVKDDAVVLHDVGSHLLSVFIRAIIMSPSTNATFADVARCMFSISRDDMDPVEVTNIIQGRFEEREVYLSAPSSRPVNRARTGLNSSYTNGNVAGQDRHNCCHTMRKRNLGMSALHDAENEVSSDAGLIDRTTRVRSEERTRMYEDGSERGVSSIILRGSRRNVTAPTADRTSVPDQRRSASRSEQQQHHHRRRHHHRGRTETRGAGESTEDGPIILRYGSPSMWNGGPSLRETVL